MKTICWFIKNWLMWRTRSNNGGIPTKPCSPALFSLPPSRERDWEQGWSRLSWQCISVMLLSNVTYCVTIMMERSILIGSLSIPNFAWTLRCTALCRLSQTSTFAFDDQFTFYLCPLFDKNAVVHNFYYCCLCYVLFSQSGDHFWAPGWLHSWIRSLLWADSRWLPSRKYPLVDL